MTRMVALAVSGHGFGRVQLAKTATIQLLDGLLDPGGNRRGRVCALTHGCVPHFRVRSCGVVMCQVCSTSMSTHANAPIRLPPPIAAYFDADASDANAVARCFSEGAS